MDAGAQGAPWGPPDELTPLLLGDHHEATATALLEDFLGTPVAAQLPSLEGARAPIGERPVVLTRVRHLCVAAHSFFSPLQQQRSRSHARVAHNPRTPRPTTRSARRMGRGHRRFQRPARCNTVFGARPPARDARTRARSRPSSDAVSARRRWRTCGAAATAYSEAPGASPSRTTLLTDASHGPKRRTALRTTLARRHRRSSCTAAPAPARLGRRRTTSTSSICTELFSTTARGGPTRTSPPACPSRGAPTRCAVPAYCFTAIRYRRCLTPGPLGDSPPHNHCRSSPNSHASVYCRCRTCRSGSWRLSWA